MYIDYILKNEFFHEVWVVIGDSTQYENFYWGTEECSSKANITIGGSVTREKPTLEELQNLWEVKYREQYEREKNKEKRLQEYPSQQELIVALWEKIVEGRENNILKIQEKRLQIKNKYPV